MTPEVLTEIRLSGRRPARIINLSLCRHSQMCEPVIEISQLNNFDGFDFRSLHGLAVDIHYWNRSGDALRLTYIISEVEPHSLYTVDHKNQICMMVYWQGQSMLDNQSFLYDWRHRPYAQ